MNKFINSVLIGFSFVIFSVAPAFAHITVNPREATVGYSVATVRVPNEKSVAVTAIRLVVPEGVTMNAVKPVPGWTASVVRDDADEVTGESGHAHMGGNILEVMWSGGQIAPGEFEEFPLSVRYATAGEIAWKAYQTYADGEVVAWDDSKGEENPSSKVAVTNESKVDSLADDVKALGDKQQKDPSLWLSVGAILLSTVSLFLVLRKR